MKIKIPKEVAEYIQLVKSGHEFKNNQGYKESVDSSLYKVMYYSFKESIAPDNVLSWMDSNKDLFSLAYLNGYEVEYSPEESIKLAYDYHKEISSDKNTHDFRKHLRADAFCEGMEYVLKELNKEIEDIKYSPIIETIKKAAIYKASKGDASYG